MNTSRRNARWAGVFYILATVAPISTLPFVGFLGGGVAGQPVPDYLAVVAANEGRVIMGMLTELVWALAVVGIIATLLPILRKHDEALAFGFSNLRFIEAVSTVIHAIILLSLLTLGQQYVAADTPKGSFFPTAGALLLAAREWTFLVGSGVVWSLSALLLNYLLYRKRLIPRWLSVWGLVGAALSVANYAVRFFGINSIEIAFLPIAAQEMVFAVWLIARGLQAPSSNSESTRAWSPLS